VLYLKEKTMKRYGFVMLAVVGLLALIGAEAFAATDLATFAPDNTLGMFSFNYSKENADRIQKSNLYMMLASEELKGCLQEFMKLIPQDAGSEELLEKTGLELSDLLALKYGGFGISFGLVEQEPLRDIVPAPEGGEPGEEPAVPPVGHEPMAAPPKPEMALYMDGANPEIKALTGKLIAAMDKFSEGEDAAFKKSDIKIGTIDAKSYEVLEHKADAPGEIVVFVSGDVTVFAAGKECATKIVNCVAGQGKGSLAQTELYTKATGKLDARRMTTFFLNTGALWEVAKGQKDVPPPVFDVLHLDSVQSVVHGMWADAEGTFGHTYIYCPDGKFFLLKPLQGGRANFETMNAVGSRAFLAMSISSDPSEFYDYVLGMIKQADENAYDQAIRVIGDTEKQIGLKFKEDILAALGSESTIVMTSPSMTFDAQFVPFPLAIIMEIKDKDKLEKVLETLYAKFDMKPRVEKYGEGGHELEVLPYFVLCRTEKHCILAASERTMEEILDTMDGKAGRLVDTARFKAARKMLGEKAAVFTYCNTKEMALGMAMASRWVSLAPLFQHGMRPVRIEGSGPPNPDAQPAEEKPKETEAEVMAKVMKQMVVLCDLFGRYFPETYSAINGEADGLSIRSAHPAP
jgi:hypothetical protein